MVGTERANEHATALADIDDTQSILDLIFGESGRDGVLGDCSMTRLDLVRGIGEHDPFEREEAFFDLQTAGVATD